MQSSSSEKPAQDPPFKPHRSKSREISSRFLSPTSPSSFAAESNLLPPNPSLSPIRPKTKSSDARKHRKAASDETSLIRGLWPSSTKKSSTLADHLGNDRLIDFIEQKTTSDRLKSASQPAQLLNRSESNRFEKDKEIYKENRPIGGSMRFTGKLRFSGKSAPPTPPPTAFSSSLITPGRLSVDENALDRRTIRRRSDVLSEFPSSESERSDMSSYSSRRSGIEVPARFMQDPTIRRGGGGSELNHLPASAENSPNLNGLGKSAAAAAAAIKRSNSLTAYASATSQWALSPGRKLPAAMTGESGGKAVQSFSRLRPQSPPKGKGMGNLLSLGLELFKSKKSSSPSSLSSASSSPRSGGGGGVAGEVAHQLRLLHNRLLQWRLANARADMVNESKGVQAETSLSNAWASLSKLQSSVVQKRIQLEKEKLQLKLNKILFSQVEPLEAWSEIERQHHSAVSTTKDCLHAVVCRVPLTEGAKGDTQPISMTFRNATDLTASIKTMITDFSPMAEKAVPSLSELAEVVSQEKSLLVECFDLLIAVTNLELQERSLRCQLLQSKSQQQQQQQQQQVQHVV